MKHNHFKQQPELTAPREKLYQQMLNQRMVWEETKFPSFYNNYPPPKVFIGSKRKPVILQGRHLAESTLTRGPWSAPAVPRHCRPWDRWNYAGRETGERRRQLTRSSLPCTASEQPRENTEQVNINRLTKWCTIHVSKTPRSWKSRRNRGELLGLQGPSTTNK